MTAHERSEQFSDERLKQFKDAMETAKPEAYIFNSNDIHPLLARLEAAEANMGGHSTKCTDKNCVCSKKDREEAWRRAKGEL